MSMAKNIADARMNKIVSLVSGVMRLCPVFVVALSLCMGLALMQAVSRV